ncbi:hypothetical protein LA303_03490 [Candidatus Sulfidibacterium hydrothermale]|uniref:hypothetical protein n=1 Tax=Candidatus Sulfidibacterium hydrothermale TaxID=2875962 RepID=UPI001F0A0FFC|nr:hypothetical protein [Candidatus Sulfidibacterium hydrothermale]UBM63047.1 hypothetical protein LA303_03490 [Candidatus Sulfidibacterium hydrothermale]
MLKVIILAVILTGLAFAALSITILLKKDGKFPETKIGHNKKIRKKGIECAFTQDYKSQKQSPGWNRPN